MSGEFTSAFLIWFILSYIHVWYSKQYQGESQAFGAIINLSAIFGPLFWTGALLYAAFSGTWWHSLIVAVICLAVGPVIARLLTGPYRGIRAIICALLAFSWPFCAFWAYKIITIGEHV